MTVQEWYSGPYSALASEIGARTGVSPVVLTAQAAVESAYGSSVLATQCHNYSGVTFVGQAGASNRGGFACYETDQAYVEDMVRILNLPLYQRVREASGIEAQTVALADSPWSASHYGGGSSLLEIERQAGYDVSSGTPAGPSLAANGPNGLAIGGIAGAGMIAGTAALAAVLVAVVVALTKEA